MGQATKRTGTKKKVPDHARLPSFEAFKGREISSIEDLAAFMEEFGVHRIYIRAPNSRSMAQDTIEAEDGTWQVGVKINPFIVDYRRSDGCDTLHEALEQVLGIKIVSPDDKAEDRPAEDDGGLLV